MRGQFDEARELYERSRAILQDLGLDVFLDALRTYAGRSRRCSRATPWQPSVSSDWATRHSSASARRHNSPPMPHIWPGSPISARQASGGRRYTKVSEDAASVDDFVSQVVWRQAQAKVLADVGELDQAESLGREAVALASETDFLVLQGDALADLGQILRSAEKPGRGRHGLTEALEAYERKGATVATERARSLLSGLDGNASRR